MKRKRFIKISKKLKGYDKGVFLLSSSLMVSNNIQCVRDVEKTLSLKLTEESIIELNKLMFSISLYKEKMWEVLSDEYFKVVNRNPKLFGCKIE